MSFESGAVHEEWKCAMIVSLYLAIGERNECKNYRGISLLSVVGKICTGILIDRVRRVNGGLIGVEKGGFRKGRSCIDQTFSLKHIDGKGR